MTRKEKEGKKSKRRFTTWRVRVAPIAAADWGQIKTSSHNLQHFYKCWWYHDYADDYHDYAGDCHDYDDNYHDYADDHNKPDAE